MHLQIISDEDGEFTGLYQDGKKVTDGDPDHIAPQTIITLHKHGLLTATGLEMYRISAESYNELLEGEPYPEDMEVLKGHLTPIDLSAWL